MNNLEGEVKYLYLLKNIVKEMYDYGIDMIELKNELNNATSFSDVYNSVVKLMEKSVVYEKEDIERNKKEIVESILKLLMDERKLKVPYFPAGYSETRFIDRFVGSPTRFTYDAHGGIYEASVILPEVEMTIKRDVRTYEVGGGEAFIDPENYDKVRITIKKGAYEDVLNNIENIVENINEQYRKMQEEMKNKKVYEEER